MNIYYNGTEISGLVQTKSCIVRDSANKADSLVIEFGNAGSWYAWKPQEDDRIVVEQDGYNSGIMYVNTIIPEDGNFKIVATSLPCRSREKRSKSYINKTIEEIIRSCALDSDMDYQVYGIDTGLTIPYIERNNEGNSAFLSRLMNLEGAVLKCVNGKYTIIGIEFAQAKNAGQTIVLSSKQRGSQYKRDGIKYKSLKIKSPYAEATATDSSVSDAGINITCDDVPVHNKLQAIRWAKNKLLIKNRQAESLTITSLYNPLITSMIRIDIEGNTDATGEWLVEDVTHDLINKETTVVMHRCISTID